MKGVLAILGLVACATAFQYSIPQTGAFYGRQNEEYGDNLLEGLYNSFHGPYNTPFYQKKYGGQYQDMDDQMYQNHQMKDAENYRYEPQDNQESYGPYMKYYNRFYSNKYFGKIQDYLKNKYMKYENEDSVEYHMPTEQENVHDFEGSLTHENKVVADEHLIKKQQHVLNLLRFINNPMYINDYFQMYKNFDIEKYSTYYQPEAHKNFMHLWENQMFLPKGQIFSIFNDVHVKQVKALFKLFYYAKDFETFLQTAVWARQRMNEGMFLYTFSVAVIYRQDCQGIKLPAIYEIYPQYFFNAEVMQKAYKYKMSHFANKQQGERTGVYTIRSNYSGYYMNLNPEQSLSYYTEDVGINAIYYTYNLYFPYWMNSHEFHIPQRRGEMFYYTHQQLLARYYLERLSHGVGGFEYFNWEVPFKTGYYPSLTYPNGLAMAERPNFANLQEYFANYGQRWCFISKYGYGYTYVSTYEQRIREAIDLGYVYTYDGKKVDIYTPEGFNVLANVIEGNADTVNHRYYGSYVNFARHLLGYSKQPLDNYKLTPSALEHYETSLRDPAFYSFFKKVTLLFQKYKTNLPAYTKKDLYYPGVKIEKIEIEPLVTFYDKFYADITNGLTVTPEEYQNTDSTFKVQVQQYRLNHKNFNYKILVNSDKTTQAVVKIFLGPKYDEHGRTMDFYENRMNFFELDQFVYTLKSGQNMITRNSREISWFSGDKMTYLDMYKSEMTGNYYQSEYMPLGMPSRYMLPRGTEAGMTYQMYVIVFPYVKDDTFKYEVPTMNIQEGSKMAMLNMAITHKYPFGYPFDRPAEFEHVYQVPNAYMKDVKIYHRMLKTDVETTHGYTHEEPKYFM